MDHAELIRLIICLSFDLLSHSGPVNPLSQKHLYPSGSGIHVPPLKQRWSLGHTGPLAEGEKIKKIGHFDIYSYSESTNRFLILCIAFEASFIGVTDAIKSSF